MVSWGSRDELLRSTAAFHAAGADHVAVIPISEEGATEDLEVLEALAPFAA
jgi:hypothetical protein